MRARSVSIARRPRIANNHPTAQRLSASRRGSNSYSPKPTLKPSDLRLEKFNLTVISGQEGRFTGTVTNAARDDYGRHILCYMGHWVELMVEGMKRGMDLELIAMPAAFEANKREPMSNIAQDFARDCLVENWFHRDSLISGINRFYSKRNKLWGRHDMASACLGFGVLGGVVAVANLIKNAITGVPFSMFQNLSPQWFLYTALGVIGLSIVACLIIDSQLKSFQKLLDGIRKDLKPVNTDGVGRIG